MRASSRSEDTNSVRERTGKEWVSHGLADPEALVDLAGFFADLVAGFLGSFADRVPHALDVFARAFHEGHLLTRVTGDVIALSPPLIVEKDHIDRIVNILADTIRATA